MKFRVALFRTARKGLLLATLIFLFSALTLFVARPAHAAIPNLWKDPLNGTCGWENYAEIKCAPSPVSSNIRYFFWAEGSLTAGHPVFRTETDNPNAVSDFGYLHLMNGTYEVSYITTEPNIKDSQGGYQQNIGGYDIIAEKKTDMKPDPAKGCGIFYLAADCIDIASGNKTTLNAAQLTQLQTDINKTADAYAAQKQSEENCTEDAGSLGFVLCPLLKGIQSSVQKLIGADGSGKGFLVELLTISPLNADASNDLYRAWQAIRDVALGLYVIVFILIIFGNGLGFDPYAIKRALPRLAVAVLLTWASFFIMQTLVDLSNLVGNALPAFLASISNKADIASFNFDLNFALAGLSVILLIVLAFVALGALLIGIAGLLARSIIIYALVLLAPLAFAAWVLPNTESLFKKWWSNLVRVLMMFPIVTGMLALALFFSKTVDQTGSSALKLAAVAAPLIAIIMIPKTFKWGGDLFAAAAGYLAGRATAGKDWGKKTAGESAKSGRVGQALNKMAENPVLGRVPGIGGVTQRQRYATIARRQAAFDKKMSEGLDKVSDGNLKNLWATQSYLDPETGQRKAKNTPYARAVEREMNSRRGKKMADFASAYRDGRYADAGRAAKGLRELDAFMGVDPSTTQSRLDNMADRINQSIGSVPSATDVDMAMGAELNSDGTVKYENGQPVYKEADSPKGGRRVNARTVGRAVGSARSRMGQGGYIDFSRGEESSASPTNPTTPPPYNGPTPSPQPASKNITPPPYTGPAPQWQPAPPTQPTSSNIPPSGPVPAGDGGTVINNVTNNVTNNVQQNRSMNANVASNPTVMAPVVSDASRQIGMLRARGSSSPGLATIETKLNDLAQMIQRGAVSQTQLRNTIREMRQEADNLPDHEKGSAHDVISNLEHQTGQNDTNTGM